MTASAAVLLLAMAVLSGGAIIVYERLLAQLRAERDELLDVLDDHVEDLTRIAIQRHPSQYGRGHIRLVK